MDAEQQIFTGDKAERYRALRQSCQSVLEGEDNLIARMSTFVCLLSMAFEDFYWTGFYLVDTDKPGELVIGPYQGTLGCLRIALGKGVCGTAAAEQKTLVVDDVHAFPGHIACDARSNSEIAVPVFDRTGTLIAVLDVDSTRLEAFDEMDARELEALVAENFGATGSR